MASRNSAAHRGGEVLVLGSANIDVVLRLPALPASGQTVLGEDALLRPGGKGANQAVAAALAGARVAFAGRVGDDSHAASIRQALTEAGVSVELLRTAPGRSSGLAAVLVAADGENAIAVSPGANHAMEPGEVESLRAAIERCDVLLAQLELPVEVVARAIELAAELATLVLLNLSPAVAVAPAVLRAVDVLVVNRSEAEYLLVESLQELDSSGLLAAAHRLRELGPAAVVLTAGADGAVFVTAADSGHVPAIPVEVRDTAGAGDAFAGVLAAALSRGRPLAEAVRAAGQAGAAAVQADGAQLSGPPPGWPRPAE